MRIGGPADRALARNASSGADSSAEASVTKTRASADGRNASVAAAWAAFRPPTPGVSTRAIPCRRKGSGKPTSTTSTPRGAGSTLPFGDPAADLVGRDGLEDELAGLASSDHGARRFGVADDGDGHRREVVVDRADGSPEERVDECALALLEFADDADDGVGAGHPLGDAVEARRQVIATPGRGEGPCFVDDATERRPSVWWGRGRRIVARQGRPRSSSPAECTLRISCRGPR